MKNILAACLLAGLIVITGCNGPGVPKPPSPAELEKEGFYAPHLPRITAEELKVMYDNKEPMTLVDVRVRSSYLDGYIPGARNIPNDPYEDSMSALAGLPKDKPIIIYCDCLDDGDSAVAAERLASIGGFNNVKVMWKGYYYWKNDLGGETRQ